MTVEIISVKLEDNFEEIMQKMVQEHKWRKKYEK